MPLEYIIIKKKKEKMWRIDLQIINEIYSVGELHNLINNNRTLFYIHF